MDDNLYKVHELYKKPGQKSRSLRVIVPKVFRIISKGQRDLDEGMSLSSKSKERRKQRVEEEVEKIKRHKSTSVGLCISLCVGASQSLM